VVSVKLVLMRGIRLHLQQLVGVCLSDAVMLMINYQCPTAAH